MRREDIDAAQEILGRHLPGVAKASEIMANRFPFQAAANALLAGRGIATRGPSFLPVGDRVTMPHTMPVPRLPRGGFPKGVSPLAMAIGENARAVAAAGKVVDINVWAHALESAGISSEVIFSSYDCAGGDAVLSAAEASGDTSGFLASFVHCLESAGVPQEIIVGTYQQSGGELG